MPYFIKDWDGNEESVSSTSLREAVKRAREMLKPWCSATGRIMYCANVADQLSGMRRVSDADHDDDAVLELRIFTKGGEETDAFAVISAEDYDAQGQIDDWAIKASAQA